MTDEEYKAGVQGISDRHKNDYFKTTFAFLHPLADLMEMAEQGAEIDNEELIDAIARAYIGTTLAESQTGIHPWEVHRYMFKQLGIYDKFMDHDAMVEQCDLVAEKLGNALPGAFFRRYTEYFEKVVEIVNQRSKGITNSLDYQGMITAAGDVAIFMLALHTYFDIDGEDVDSAMFEIFEKEQ